MMDRQTILALVQVYFVIRLSFVLHCPETLTGDIRGYPFRDSTSLKYHLLWYGSVQQLKPTQSKPTLVGADAPSTSLVWSVNNFSDTQ